MDLEIPPGQVVCFERLVAVTRSDALDQDPGAEARTSSTSRVASAGAAWSPITRRPGQAAALRRGRDRWDEARSRPRFAIYHLNGAANPADERVSIGARALTGDDYLGHVFWDTEIYLLPFYILTWPEAARALLMYRFHTLDAARAKAVRLGWRGALYAWESADTGAEACPEQVIVRIARSSMCLAAGWSSTSAPMSPTPSGNTGCDRG